jgi:hypothetical protein
MRVRRVPRRVSTRRATDFFLTNAHRKRRNEVRIKRKSAQPICIRSSRVTTLSLHSIRSRLSAVRHKRKTPNAFHIRGFCAPTRTRTWNPLIKSPAMMSQFAQIRGLLGSWFAINCYRLSHISIELLHFHYTHSGLSPPALCGSEDRRVVTPLPLRASKEMADDRVRAYTHRE